MKRCILLVVHCEYKDVTFVRNVGYIKLNYKIPEDQSVQNERRGNLKSRIYRGLSRVPRLLSNVQVLKATMHEKEVAAIGVALLPDFLNLLNFTRRESRKSL